MRGYWSWLAQPPAAAPNWASSKLGAAKWPPPVASDTTTPVLLNPTMSASPSPFTSASTRGYWSWLLQPPPIAPNWGSSKFGAANCPPPLASETTTPVLLNPTMSASPSPFTSASTRGYRSWLLQPPPALPNWASSKLGAAKRPLPVAI